MWTKRVEQHVFERFSLFYNLRRSKQEINPFAAELFVSIFHSFEAGIANAISSFKWWKIVRIYDKIGFSNIEVYWIN